jgi:hypothetical protein
MPIVTGGIAGGGEKGETGEVIQEIRRNLYCSEALGHKGHEVEEGVR